MWRVSRWVDLRNYLRVRGEYAVGVGNTRGDMELPPRARRIHQLSNQIADMYGTTSACAENTDQGLEVECG